MQELIYNQTEIPKEQWRYGLRPSAQVGCGWVAAYNALVLLGQTVDIPDLIRRFQRMLPIIHGNAGTIAPAPALLLKSMGYTIQTAVRPGRFDAVAGECPVSILFYYWRQKYRFGAHFVTVWKENGRFLGCNTYTNSKGPDDYGPSLEAFLKERKYFGCILFGIKNDP